MHPSRASSLKWFGLLFSVIVLISGATTLAMSLRLLFDPTYSYLLTQNGLYLGGQILAAAGALVFIGGIVGCVAFTIQNSCLLSTFIGLMLALATVEIVAGVLTYGQLPAINEKVHYNIHRAVMRHYGHDNTNTTYVNLIQQEWECCGTNSYTSWSDSEYAKVHNPLTTHLSTNKFVVPKSCCIDPKSEQCDRFNFDGIQGKGESVANVIYREGCSPKLVAAIDTFSQYLFGLGSGIVVIQFIALILAACFICLFRSRRHVKPYFEDGSHETMLDKQGHSHGGSSKLSTSVIYMPTTTATETRKSRMLGSSNHSIAENCSKTASTASIATH